MKREGVLLFAGVGQRLVREVACYLVPPGLGTCQDLSFGAEGRQSQAKASLPT